MFFPFRYRCWDGLSVDRSDAVPISGLDGPGRAACRILFPPEEGTLLLVKAVVMLVMSSAATACSLLS